MTIRIRKYLRTAIVSTALLASLSAAAEVAYVSDTLRVGVRPEPDTQLVPISVVTTGMKLEVLERRDGYVRIRTEQGKSGWIKDIYVVKTPPAGIRLKELQARHAALEKQHAELEVKLKQLTTTNLKLKEQLANLQNDYVALENRNKEQQAALLESAVLTEQETPWLWWLLGLIVVAVVGFFSGVSWYRQQLAKRLGGLRV